MANKIKKFFHRLFLTGNVHHNLNIVSQPIFEPFRELEVIVFKVDFLGDFVLAIPALVALKEKIKSEKIDIVVGEWNVGLARRTGLFRNVYIYNGLARYEIAKEKLADEERKLQVELPIYDMAVEFRRGKDSKNPMSWIKAACKIGSNSYQGANQSLDISLELVEEMHESMQMMRIVDAVPVRVFDLPDWGSVQGAEQSKTLSLFPFSGNPAKEWPLDHYVDLSRKLVEQKGFDEIHVFCSLEERQKSSAFAECRNVRVHSGLPAEELISILRESNAVISNDSFGAHLASYLHIPLVVIYSSGQSRSQEWQPSFGPMAIIRPEGSCTRCNRTQAKSCAQKRSAGCLQQIKTEDILSELNRVISMTDERKIKQNKVMLVG